MDESTVDGEIETDQPVLVLGMHRSGTSSLTGLLEEAGLFLGDVKRQSAHNAKGSRESPAVWSVNDAMLREAGGSWRHPPAAPPVVTDHHVSSVIDLVSGFPDDRAWGVKDPRILLVLEVWRRALPAARLVTTVRHPAAVARSLAARNGMEFDEAISLWAHYNSVLLEACRRGRVPIVSFDDDPSRYIMAVRAMVTSLGLREPAGGFEFFDDGLRSRRSETSELPGDVRGLYAELLSLADDFSAVGPTS